MLEFVDVTLRAGNVRVLAGVRLRLDAGGPVVVLGLPSQGRRALARVLTGKQPPLRGSVTLRGTPLKRQMKRFGAVEAPRGGIAPGGQVAGDVLQAARRSARSLAGAPDIDALARAADLAHRLTIRVRDLSTGERMRLGIAAAASRRPDILVIDSPAALLTGATRTVLLEALPNLLSSIGANIIYLADSPDEAEAIGGRTLVLVDGRVAQFSAADEVFGNPCSLRVAALTSAPVLNTLPLTISGGAARLADGASFAPDEPVSLPKSGTCTLAFRPRDLRLSRPSASALRFAVRAAGAETIDGVRYVRVVLAGSTWLAAAGEETDAAEGFVLNVFVERDAVMVFDASGLSLSAGAAEMLFEAV